MHDAASGWPRSSSNCHPPAGGCEAGCALACCRLGVLTVLAVVSVMLVLGPWQQTCVRNALSVGLTEGNNGSVVGAWMQANITVRLPREDSVLELITMLPDVHTRVEVVNRSA